MKGYNLDKCKVVFSINRNRNKNRYGTSRVFYGNSKFNKIEKMVMINNKLESGSVNIKHIENIENIENVEYKEYKENICFNNFEGLEPFYKFLNNL